MTKNYGKKPMPYELILFFERFKFTPSMAYDKLRLKGYAKRTIYRYHKHWLDADQILKTIQKDI